MLLEYSFKAFFSFFAAGVYSLKCLSCALRSDIPACIRVT